MVNYTHIRYAWTDSQEIMHNITAHIDRAEIIRMHLITLGIPEGTPEEHITYIDGHWQNENGQDACFPSC